jgi:hypothetical protein
MPDFLIRLAITFVVRQLAKFGRDTDWEKVKVDLDQRVRKLVPGNFFDDAAVEIVFTAVDAIAEILTEEESWVKLLTLLAAGKTQEAIDLLIKLVKDRLGL